MPIEDMIANARTAARKNGEGIHPYWGDYLSVVKLHAAYYGGFNVGNMDNHNALRFMGIPYEEFKAVRGANDKTLAVYRAVHAALDTECSDECATILSELLRKLALNYRAEHGRSVGEALGWS